jgi:tetratricopeptide (TPR) repeat protein
LDQAVSECTTAILLDPAYAGGYINRGHAFLAQDLLDRAIADLTTAINLDPKIVLPLISRGQAHARQKNYQLAIADLEQALVLEPDNTTARHSLVVTLVIAKKPNDARDHVRRLLERQPASRDIQTLALRIGKSTGDKALVERTLSFIEQHHPHLLDEAKKFIGQP